MTSHGYRWHAEAWHLAQAALARGAHALLIAGARGLGKRELALDLAASYLCAVRGEDGLACGVCESCHWLAAGTHPDFTLVEPPADDENAERGASQPGSSPWPWPTRPPGSSGRCSRAARPIVRPSPSENNRGAHVRPRRTVRVPIEVMMTI